MSDTAKIRDLNDAFRTTLVGGTVLVTRGIESLADLAGLVDEVRQYNQFAEENDPHQEHDFGSILYQGRTIFWKIDYYDLDMLYGSENPADNAVTRRVLTVMLAEEY